MKVVIQCAGGKRPGAGRLRDTSGREIRFVARPELGGPLSASTPHRCRPDDSADPGEGTWRDVLRRYNALGANPHGLLAAGDLYRHPVYRELVAAFGREDVFVLSAGWGLIRSDFLTPDYDITFSASGEPESRRRTDAVWQDFNHLADARPAADDEVHFFGGRDYLPLFYSLTGDIAARKVVHHKGVVNRRPGFEYEAHQGAGNTNWHYGAARAFIRGRARG